MVELGRGYRRQRYVEVTLQLDEVASVYKLHSECTVVSQNWPNEFEPLDTEDDISTA